MLREKLSRFPAGGSSIPAEKINFHHRSFLPSVHAAAFSTTASANWI